ncbi:MAG: SUMF1/EgtB/PvdO family nonheme iron enzyme [Alphaproteobacteria bacterium]|nr:SUMF1/EgtB/PvdO family nonheme iron enzyme [Alphaproteobacteria bacterium]
MTVTARARPLANTGGQTLTPLRWVHLSDIHAGCRGEAYWQQMVDAFRADVLIRVERIGLPDLILLTGDIANVGAADEYDRFNRFLDDLRGWLRDAGGTSDPLIIPVPGNHDLARPTGAAARQYRILGDMPAGDADQHIRELRREIWTDGNTSFFDPLFQTYLDWCKTSVRPHLDGASGVSVRYSHHFPGDLSVRIARSDRPHLTVVGLNTAWMQCAEGDYRGRIELFAEQFSAATGAAPLTTPGRNNALLLMHHPLDWFSPASQTIFKELVYPTHPEPPFLACLHGHMHTAQSEVVAWSGGQARRFFQAPSLFGLEHYGTARETRAIGYAWGELTAEGRVRVWPLRYERRGDGSASFGFDPAFHDGGNPSEGVVLCEARQPAPSPPPPTIRATGGPAPAEAWIEEYKAWALRTMSRIKLIGIGGGDLEMTLDAVWVALGIVPRPEDLSGGTHRHDVSSDTIALDGIFAAAGANMRVAIHGEPGSGKTTALRKLLHLCLTSGDGPEALALDRRTVPIFLRLRRFTTDLLDEEAPLKAFISRELAEMAGADLLDDVGDRLWERGHLLLLFDGLDEIADPDRRAAVAKYLNNSQAEWTNRHIRAVVSSRFSGYDGKRIRLTDRFRHFEVRPLDDTQTHDFVRQWFRHAYAVLKRGGPTKADAQAEVLLADLKDIGRGSRRIRTLVATPLMLTLLCLLFLRGGRIPQRRVEFYDECLRVLLERWDAVRDLPPPLDRPAALAVLRPLAWYLHNDSKGREVSHAEAVNVIDLNLPTVAEVDAFAVLAWLCDRTGVLIKTGEDSFGFMHLGFQEYLAAAHAASMPQTHLGTMAGKADDDWWLEPLLLLAGMANRELFGTLAGRLLTAVTSPGRADLLRKCLAEAAEPDLTPFLDRLTPETDPGILEAVLTLLAGRTGPDLREAARPLASAKSSRIRELAGRFVVDGVPERPATGRDFDVLLVHGAADQAWAEELIAAPSWRGRSVRPPSPPWLPVLNDIPGTVGTVVVLAGAEPPWSDRRVGAGLAFLGRRGVRVVVMRRPGTGAAELPPDLVTATVIDGDADPFGPTGVAPRTGRTVVVDPTTGIRLVSLPDGEFMMGSTDGGKAERPVRRVRVPAFLLGETPVTNRQYGKFLEASKRVDEPRHWRDRRFSDPDLPVVGVSWNEAKAFCAWLSDVSGRPCRLASEAEWEYACRAGESGAWCFGDDGERLPDYAWFAANSGRHSRPVATLRANAFGLYDMHGNVWEWVEDCWNDGYEGAPSDGEAWTSGDCKSRVVRGGSWGGFPWNVRSATRKWFGAGLRNYFIGFRLARTLP